MAPSAALNSFTRSRMRRLPHERLQRRTDVFRRPVSLCIRRRAGGAAQRSSTEPLSLRLPGRHKDCSRSPRHVFQRKCRHDVMSSCTLGTAAAPGNCSILPCFGSSTKGYAPAEPCQVMFIHSRGHRLTSFRSGCPGTARTAAGLLATSASASATMTPSWAALWDQQEQQVATAASRRASGSGTEVPASAK
ncbi:uncharacterized protein LOC142566714 [Dermacentor variabilis]|uniref:uncharacterized protein LOC142566714 n=1 Tax=Dermacentor variabilis TaxID=34621 RepID=UPI003F5BA7FD